jgi:type I restriction enzyme S subunit
VCFSNQQINAVIPDPTRHDPLYVFYLLSTTIPKLQAIQGGSASGREHVNKTNFGNISVLVHPLSVQHKIASVLSTYDDLIENNTRRIAILEEIAQALYREWFVRFRFPGHEKVPLVPSPLGDIPQGWNVVKVEDAAHVNPRTTVLREGEKHFVPMSAVPHNTMLIDVSQVEMRAGNSGSKFKNGDTLFARITPCLENGKTAFVAFLPSVDDVAFGSTEFIVLRSKTVCPEYVYLLARSDPFRDNAIKSMSGATGRQRVQEKCFDKFLIAHPDPDTIEAFSAAVKPLFQAVFNLAKKNVVLRKSRDLLLPKLISGRLEVEHLDIDMGEHVTA